ncbi:MAG: hypothetical protein MUO62_15160 [Anaerolineales bacterium]|nr:hypothetical protein [Anaerolineales bacterium]
MKITSDLLYKYARATVDKRTHRDYTVLAVYLTGSMVTEENPLLGGTADIDLVFIHIGDPQVPREILSINKDIHIDIAHHPQRDYLERITLRTHPWMGPVLSEAVVLYDPQHFMGLTQASVRGLFHQPGNVIQRAQSQMETARRRWFDFQPIPENPGPTEIMAYLQVLNCAANAIALLVGEPLTERRFLINFPKSANRAGHPGLYPGLLGMLGAPKVDPETLVSWTGEWTNTFHALPTDNRHPRLHPYRQNYYRKAFDVILESDQPLNILWPLLRTWTLAAEALPESDPGYQSWKDACQHMGLLGSGFGERVLALDAFLEQVEGAIRTWGTVKGA